MMEENDNQSVSLQEMLMAKEARVMQQTKILHQYHTSIICFTLNIMGPMKSCRLYEQCYQVGKQLITKRLQYAGLTFGQRWETAGKTGSECIWSVCAPAEQIKQLMIEIEINEEIGRVFDIDVLNADGTKVSRTQLGYQPRKCFICDALAAACARSRNHGLEQLVEKTRNIIETYLTGRYADEVAGKALQALLYEVSATPKAGLVDRWNNGSHHDMNYITFLDSSSILVPYFRKAVLAGTKAAGTMNNLFEQLRLLGKQAEIDMYRITNGINTHKGAIFSLGILCGAAGFLWKEQGGHTLLELCRVASDIATDSLKDFEQEPHPLSNGEIIFKKYGISGARAEAVSGFRSARELALPILQNCLAESCSVNDSSVFALLVLISQVYDTNIIKRAGLQTQTGIHCQITQFLEQQPDINAVLDYMTELDREFQRQHISAGGCADLLAVTWFLQLLVGSAIM